MNFLTKEIMVNINSFGTFSAIIVLVFFITCFAIYSHFFHKVKLVRYSILLQFVMCLYLVVFLVLVNSTDPEGIFQTTRLLYAVLMLHAVTAIYTISHIINRKIYMLKIFSVVSSSIITTLIYISDDIMVTREILATTYYSTVKGPLFPLTNIYILLLGIFFVIDFIVLYIKKRELFKNLWPIYLGIIFFTFYSNLLGVALLINPYVKPTLYINSLVFLLLFLIYIFKQIKKNLKEREDMYRSYLYDELTQVHTRNYLIEKIKEVVNKRHNLQHYVAMIDIDGFKKINDSYGHLVGDKVLHTFGQLLNEIELPNTFPGRLGGDEFIILFNHATKADIIKVLNDLLKSYTFALTQMNVNVIKTNTGLSIGLMKIEPDMSLKEILSNVDETMYKAKKNGKNSIEILTID